MKNMEKTEIILGCIVHTYEIKNDDFYGSDINETMLSRHRRAKELDKKCERFSPMMTKSPLASRIA